MCPMRCARPTNPPLPTRNERHEAARSRRRPTFPRRASRPISLSCIARPGSRFCWPEFLLLDGALGVRNLAARRGHRSTADDSYQYTLLFARVLQLDPAGLRRSRARSSYKDLTYAALRGMLSSLDPHSQFLDEESFPGHPARDQGRVQRARHRHRREGRRARHPLADGGFARRPRRPDAGRPHPARSTARTRRR